MQANCAYCGEPFHPKRSKQTLCSPRCNARKRASEGTLAPNPRKLPITDVVVSLYESGLSCVDIAGATALTPQVCTGCSNGGVLNSALLG
jgi:hypothetical protein